MSQFNSAVRNNLFEVDIALRALHAGQFTIIGIGFNVGKTVTIQQVPGPYTGKGTLADEAEMGQVIVTGYVFDSTTIKCYWVSIHAVRGNIKFAFKVDR